MSLTSHSLLATMISLALYGPAMAADITATDGDSHNQQTIADPANNASHGNKDPLTMVRGVCIPEKDRQQDTNNEPIHISANRVEAQQNKTAVYSGDVVVKQGTRTIVADKATLQQPTNIVTANGNVFYQDGSMDIDAKRLTSNLDTKDAQMDNAVYRMTCQAGRGDAKLIERRNVDGTQFYKMKDGTYTTCPSHDKSWRFAAGSLEREGDSPFADLYNARFEVLNFPIFYLPWLRVPVTDQRLTGFLYPSISYGSKNGMELETPFYWNIAPNYDLTFTPKYMNHRGLQLTSEFRYLTDFGQGKMVGEYLGHDKKYQDYDKRWGIQWTHSGIIDKNWLLNIDYSKVSDPKYFDDVDSIIGQREDNNLLQTASLAYRNDNWDTSLMVRDFQPLTENGEGTQYRLMPQLSSTYYKSDLPYGLDFSLPMSISKFDTDDRAKPTADRVTFDPTLTLPYATPWWSVTTQAKLNYAHYNQQFDVKQNPNLSTLDKTVDRTVPEFRVNSSLYFERDTSIMGEHYTQSLEPQLQYLYVKNVDQSGIYNPVNYNGGGYDSTRLQQDYYGLFSDRTYSGQDYIAPANQFTVGATTRYYDANFKERFTLSLGQIFYIDKPVADGSEAKSYSATALETEFNLDDNLFFKSSMQYDSSENEVQQGSTAIEYRNGRVFIQPSYRYVSSNYLNQYVANPNPVIPNTNGQRDGISQLGVSTGFPINDNIDITADYFQDINVNKMLESRVGLVYRSACWMIGLSYNRYAKDPLSQNFTEYDSNVSFSFSLLGLQGARPLGQASDDGGNILGYADPFTLKN
ncbi:LPS assembly protein LptD [Photobacterium phosphoreum]|uniref:LPS assembly protein LptD n=1 Tax=Photobacterium phosphoreum TaxID=659 RepID=UPI0024B9D0F3|nr:LPS assembly protein LptD [Photobacterium phosphoreum]